jgi:hypothetical protein
LIIKMSIQSSSSLIYLIITVSFFSVIQVIAMHIFKPLKIVFLIETDYIQVSNYLSNVYGLAIYVNLSKLRHFFI